MMSILAPNAVYDLSPHGLGMYEGLRAIQALFEEWWSAYDALESEVQETLELPHGVIFVKLLQRGRPVGSTGLVQHRQGWVMAVEDGKVTRVTAYLDCDEALAAAARAARERADL